MLEHYTSVEGFRGILSTKNLRMTRVEFMNDPLESRVMRNIIERYLENSNKEMKTIEAVAEVLKKKKIEGKIKETKDLHKKANVMDYMDFILENIRMYVLSLTSKDDKLEIWNYYGNGGIQLSIDEEKLMNEMEKDLKELKNPEAYVACGKVIYVKEGEKPEEIPLNELFESFNLRGIDTKMCGELTKVIKKQHGEDNTIKKFVDLFTFDYYRSMEFLRRTEKIGDDSEKEEILSEIYENQNSVASRMLFKKGYYIYMIILSALVKTASYKYEEETRIIYFENLLAKSEGKRKDSQFIVKPIGGQSYLCPYIEFKVAKIGEALNAVTISPTLKNVPIEEKVYMQAFYEFVESHSGNEGIKVGVSQHKIRW